MPLEFSEPSHAYRSLLQLLKTIERGSCCEPFAIASTYIQFLEAITAGLSSPTQRKEALFIWEEFLNLANEYSKKKQTSSASIDWNLFSEKGMNWQETQNKIDSLSHRLFILLEQEC